MRKSTLTGKHIYSSKSGIQVKGNKDYRWICFDENMIQSIMNIKHPERIMMPYINPFITFVKEDPGMTLLLGLGGGSCIHALTDIPMHVVESSNEMVAIARKYFQLPQLEHLRIKCLKAEDYIQQNQNRYLHLLIDLGDKEGFPPSCLKPIFFQQCLNALDEDGYLCVNLANIEDAKKVNDILKTDLNLKTLCVQIQGNYLIHYSKKLSKSEILEHFKKKFTIINHTWDQDNGEILSIGRIAIPSFKRTKTGLVTIWRFISTLKFRLSQRRC